MVTQACISTPMPTSLHICAFPQPQRLLREEQRKLQLSENGQMHSISVARNVAASARMRISNSNARCAATQTERSTSKKSTSTIPVTPTKDTRKPPKLDDGSGGFPPWKGGGGGGGGGGGNFYGGFYFFALLVFFDYLKELEGNEDEKLL